MVDAFGTYREAFRRAAAISILSLVLNLSVVRRGHAEARVDFKTLYYLEDNDRIQVIAPSMEYEREFDNGFSLRLEGTYNVISGASPTGAPPIEEQIRVETITIPGTPAPPQPVPSASPGGDDDDDDDDDEEGEDPEDNPIPEAQQRAGSLGSAAAAPAAQNVTARAPISLAGATPPPAPPAPVGGGGGGGGGGGTGGGTGSRTYTREVRERVPTDSVPKADVEDTRVGLNLEIGKRLGRHKPAVLLAYSEESDYRSLGVSLKDNIDFNEKNTTLLLGVGGTFDTLEGLNIESSETKNSYDAIVGVTQVLTRKMLGTANFTVGTSEGYLSDPYKFAEIDQVLYAERRPETRDKWVLYLALTRYVEFLNGSAEVSLRHYDDTFGIVADTFGLAWYQKIGEHFIVRPAVRYYTQSAADFYAVQFTGNPEFYSADYRVSAFDSLGYGLKFIVKPNDRLSLDLAVERYVQDGTDGVTIDDAYASSTYLIAGVRLWF